MQFEEQLVKTKWRKKRNLESKFKCSSMLVKEKEGKLSNNVLLI